MESKTGQPGRKNDNAVINRIMLKYRPIAPKPLPEGSEAVEAVPYKRTKRKYVRVKKNTNCNSGNNEEAKGGDDIVGALDDESPTSGGGGGGSSTMWSFIPEEQPPVYPNYISLHIGINPCKRVVESWLVVDGITETFLYQFGIDGKIGGGVLGMGSEKMRSLEVDSCPVLISDSEHRVQYMNLAYKNMVVLEGGGDVQQPTVEMAVWLVLNERLPETLNVFTCRVRVVYTCHEEKHSMSMPCDVCRMDFGGFAWRLDSKAALKLGR